MPSKLQRMRSSSRSRRRAPGFTLIELLVVMAVIALLLSIALPRFHDSLDRSKDVVLSENLKVLRVSLDQFFADKGRYPETLDELVEQRYLRSVPVDPLTDSPTTWITQPSRDPDRKGIADVRSGAAGQSRDGKRYESF